MRTPTPRHAVRMVFLICSACAVLLLFAGAAFARKSQGASPQVCDDFFDNVIRDGKFDDSSKYLTDDFIEHNVNLTANSRVEFVTRLRAYNDKGGFNRFRTQDRAAAALARSQRTVFAHDDVVVFIVKMAPADDPDNPGQKIVRSHFDVYKFRNGKIAEHWD